MVGRQCQGGSGGDEITRTHCCLQCVRSAVKVWLVPLGLGCHSVFLKQSLRCVSAGQVTGQFGSLPASSCSVRESD